MSTVYPVPTTAVSTGPYSWKITATTPNTPYQADAVLPAGYYTVTCVSTTVARVQFFSNATTAVIIGATTSGTATILVPTDCTSVVIWTDTGSDIQVGLTCSSQALLNDVGTLESLETISSSTTYTNTSTSGYAFAIAVAGGGGGGGGGSNTGAPWYGASGGGSGGVNCGIIALTGSVAITIGTGGAGGGNQANGSTGGTTTVGGLTATGGGGGNYARNGGSSGGSGGSPGGVTAASSTSSNGQFGVAGAAGVNPYTFVTGSGVMGTGGAGRSTSANGGSGTLGGGGGGASASYSAAGGTGGDGVVYIMRY